MLAETLPKEVVLLRNHFAAQSTKKNSDRIAWQTTLASLSERIGEAATDVAVAERNHPDKSEAVAPFREKLRRLKQERARTTAPAIGDPWPEIERFVETARDFTVVPTEPDIRKSETPLAAHNRIQPTTDAILRQIKGVQTAPAPADDLIAGMYAQIAALAAHGKPRLLPNGRLELPQMQIGAVFTNDGVALLAWACQAQLNKACETLASPDGGVALTAAQRAEQLDELYGKLTKNLRQEAATATAAEQAGQRVERRRHVHPAILLGIAVNPAIVFKHLSEKKGI